MYKVLGEDGKESSPISADQLRQWIAQGRAVHNTKVQTEGSIDWEPLSELPEFSGLFVSSPPPPATPTPVSSRARTSGFAIASVICGALGLFTCITAPVGLFLGIIAKSKIKKSEGRIKGSGLATTGIIISCVTFTFYVIAFVLPIHSSAKGKALIIRCTNNIKQLGLAARMYAEKNNNKFPSAKNWSDLLSPMVANTNVFICPRDTTHRASYAFNAKLGGKNLNEVNPKTVLFFESNSDWNASGGSSDLAVNRHASQIIICFADGSVERRPTAHLEFLRWDP